MTIQDLVDFSEITGAIGVISALVFVGWQVRENTRATRLRTQEQVTQTCLTFLRSILVDPQSFASRLRSEDPDEGQKTYFFSTMPGFFKHFELMYVQYSQGVMDKETWRSGSEHIRMQFHQPGARL